MKNRLLTITLGAEAALCVLFCALGGAADAVLTFPLAPIGGWLRRLSLSGSLGNGAAIVIYVLLCLLPAGLFLIRRLKGKRHWEDLLQLVLAPWLRSISFQVEFPVLSVAVALAALRLSRLLGEGKELKEDNDLFV